MSTDFDNNNANAQNRAGAAVPQQEREERSERRERTASTGRRESISNFENQHSRPMAVRSNSDVLNAYRDGVAGALERGISGTYKGNFGVLAFDKQTIKTAYSVLLLYFNESVGGKRVSSIFKLILDATGTAPISPKRNYGGQQYAHIMVPSDLDGAKLNAKLSKSLIDQFGGNVELLDAGTLVVYSQVDAKDEAAMTAIATSAANACFEILAKATGEEDAPFSRNSLGENDQLSVNIDDNPTALTGIDGLPIRSDIRITLSGSEKGVRDEDLDDGMHSASQELTEIDTYVDVLHRGDEAYNAKPQYGRNNREIFAPLYQPVVNITNVQNRVSMMSPELALTAIATASVLAENSEFLVGLKPRFDDRRAAIRDVGALGFEWDRYRDPRGEAKRIDTQAADYDNRRFREDMDEMLTEYPVIRLHVPIAGPQAWILGSLVGAASGETDLEQLWYKAADNLTLGQFGDIFRQMNGDAIVHRIEDMGLLSTYRDNTGTLRDGREIDDYIAQQALFAADNPDVADEWAQTHEAIQVPIDVRLAKRAEILGHASGGTLVVKGRYEILEIDGVFLRALVAGMAKARMNITAGNLHIDYRAGQSRGYSNSGRNALDNSVGSLFRRGGDDNRRDRDERGSYGRSSRYGGGRGW